MGKIAIDVELFRGKPATRYVTYSAKPELGKSSFYSTTASMEILVELFKIPGTGSNLRAHKRNKELLPKSLKVTLEWDDNPNSDIREFNITEGGFED